MKSSHGIMEWNVETDSISIRLQERVSGQGGGPEDGAGEAREFHSWRPCEVTRGDS